MAYDAIRNSTLTRTLADVLGDLSDLVQKEIRLARAEFTAKITSGVRSSLWMMVAALLGLVAALLVIEAIVFALASFGLALYWACLLVAGVLGGCGAAAFAYGRSAAREILMPIRGVRQISEDIKTAKEQLT
jgi:Putative Actinobacterial Holin-X, holin superfamily III